MPNNYREAKWMMRNNQPINTLSSQFQEINGIKTKISELANNFNVFQSKLKNYISFSNNNINSSQIYNLIKDINSAQLKVINTIEYITNQADKPLIENLVSFCNKYNYNLRGSPIIAFALQETPLNISLLFAEKMEDLEKFDILLLQEAYLNIQNNNDIRNNAEHNKFTSFMHINGEYIIVSVVVVLNDNNLYVFSSCVNCPYTNNDAISTLLDTLDETFNNTIIMPSQFESISQISNLTNNEILSKTAFEFGTNFTTLQILDTYNDYWKNKYITECYSVINTPIIPTITDIYNAFIKNYSVNFNDVGQITVTTYYFEDILYFVYGKICLFNGTPCIILNNINVTNLFPLSGTLQGDTAINGNLYVTNNTDNKSTFTVDTNLNLLNAYGKLGINCDKTNTTAILTIDNITVDTILQLIENLAPYYITSYDVTQNILNYDLNESTYSIPPLFDYGNELFDYKNECMIFEIDLYAVTNRESVINPNIFELRHIRNIYNNTQITFNNSTFLNRVKNIFINTSNLLSEFTKIYDPKNIMSYIELIQDDALNWYVACITGIITYSYKTSHEDWEKYLKLTCIMTLYNVNDLMKVNYNKPFVTALDYFSHMNYRLNFLKLLAADSTIFNSLLEQDTTKYSNAISSNLFFKQNIGLNEISKSFIFTEHPTDQMCIADESFPIFNFKRSNELWNGNVIVGAINTDVYEQFLRLYNNRRKASFPVYYLWNARRSISFRSLFDFNGIKYEININVRFPNLMNDSIKVNGDITSKGELYISNIQNDIVFKVNNIDKCVYNAYNVGIGVDKPKHSLHIKDTTIQNIINLNNETTKIMNNINKVKKLCISSNDETQFTTIMYQNSLDISELILGLFKIDTNTMLAKDVLIVYNTENTRFNGYTFESALKRFLNPSNNENITFFKNIVEQILNYEIIYNSASTIFTQPYITNISNYIVKFFTLSNGDMYMLININNVLKNNINYSTNQSVQLFYRCEQYCMRKLTDIYQQISDVGVVYNGTQGQLMIGSAPSKFINTFAIKIDKLTYDSKLYDVNLSTYELSEQLLDNSFSKRLKIFDLVGSLVKISSQLFNVSEYFTSAYEDDINDYICYGICIETTETHVTLLFYEINIQNIINSSLFIEGDTLLNGDLVLNNPKTSINYVSIDPDQQYFGIGSDIRKINYYQRKFVNTYSSITTHNVHIHRDRYPVMVCDRIQEIENDNSYNYFKTYSAMTAKRSSELFTFNEMYNGSLINETLTKLPEDKVTHVRYGSDISFEIENKNALCVEIGALQFTIDSVDENNIPKGGFGVLVYDNVDTASYRRNIMYVTNDSTLHVNKISLNGNILSVNGSDLLWNGKKVLTEE